MASLFLSFSLFFSQTVIELDDLVVEGEVRRPSLIELRESGVQSQIESLSFQTLIDLERRLLEPKEFNGFSERQRQ